MFMKILLIIASVAPMLTALESFNASISEITESRGSEILSRRKRFLIFPDGSSFQLVFCTQNQGYLQIGDIVWFGTTAALAWELPTDPAVFKMFKEQLRDKASRRQDGPNKHIYYLDDVGKIISKVPYKRKPIVNPAFARRSISNTEDIEISITKKIFIKKMHEMQRARSYLHNFDDASARFHREGRHGFYKKLETFFEALGVGGRDCILRMICEVGKAKETQGTFLEELFRATFTLPKGSSDFEEQIEYDKARDTAGDCATLYPECDDLHNTNDGIRI